MNKTIIIVILMLFISGCTWTPKLILPKDFRIILVPKFENETLEPQLVEVITKRVIEKFELDGRLTITESTAKADGVLFGNIVKHKRVPLSFTEKGELDVNTLSMGINISLRDVKTREWIHKDAYIEETIQFNFKSEPVETELDAQKRLIEILSDKIISKVIEGW